MFYEGDYLRKLTLVAQSPNRGPRGQFQICKLNQYSPIMLTIVKFNFKLTFCLLFCWCTHHGALYSWLWANPASLLLHRSSSSSAKVKESVIDEFLGPTHKQTDLLFWGATDEHKNRNGGNNDEMQCSWSEIRGCWNWKHDWNGEGILIDDCVVVDGGYGLEWNSHEYL